MVRLLPVLLVVLGCVSLCSVLEAAQQQQHSSNFAVLVSSSRSWRNYRHTSNLLSIYRTVKRLGIPDSNILLFLADDHACNPRNPWKATMYKSDDHALNVYGDNVEVDYRGYEVTIENLLRVLTGRHDPAVPKSKRLLSDRGSNILIYMTGHGGDEFLKFQDVAELLAQDLADALDQMTEKERYNEVLLMVETCEANTLTNRITAPRIITMASSLKGESSYSYRNDYTLGQALVDRFTHATLEFAEKVDLSSEATLQDLVSNYRFSAMSSHYAHRILPGINRSLSEVKLTEFFGGVSTAHLLPQAYPLGRRPDLNQHNQHGLQGQQPDPADSRIRSPAFQGHGSPKPQELNLGAFLLEQQQQTQQHYARVQVPGQQDWVLTAAVVCLCVVLGSASFFSSKSQPVFSVEATSRTERPPSSPFGEVKNSGDFPLSHPVVI
ncbi:peptidase C13 family-domain-containing protein [Dunaliella salina]|uniref:Peptidase C13 family-domain-containing protein n=1 Tax=Dunaliella salina TaxID=3046 RepID=A0ABQ7FXJ1_DUNSA|nr:peptidase C13 family-domain-containing protein [Dunaliella salina]|eukprot:KAF5827065.1 peptidase C13 family-domain-containing protein [Dunaliella salina]